MGYEDFGGIEREGRGRQNDRVRASRRRGAAGGLNAAIIDLDPQGSSADWCDRRGSAPEGVAIPPSRLEKLIADLRGNETDLVVLDCGRDSHNAGYLAAMASDFALIPMRTGGFDFQALSRTLDMCRLASKRPCLLLNGMRPGATRAEKDAREALAGEDRDIAPMIMHTRAAYATASITARTAQENEPDSAASEEIAALYKWVAGQLGLSTTRQHNKPPTPQRKRKAAT